MCGSTGTEEQMEWCLWELIHSTGDPLSRAKSFPRNSRSLRERRESRACTGSGVSKPSASCSIVFEVFSEKGTIEGDPCLGVNDSAQLLLAVTLVW